MRLRISRAAQADLDRVLAESANRWGTEASERYAATVKSAMRKIAAAPEGPTPRPRADLSPGIRSFHIGQARAAVSAKVKNPVHVIYFRVTDHGELEVLRILHQRMEPSRHLRAAASSHPSSCPLD